MQQLTSCLVSVHMDESGLYLFDKIHKHIATNELDAYTYRYSIGIFLTKNDDVITDCQCFDVVKTLRLTNENISVHLHGNKYFAR